MKTWYSLADIRRTVSQLAHSKFVSNYIYYSSVVVFLERSFLGDFFLSLSCFIPTIILGTWVVLLGSSGYYRRDSITFWGTGLGHRSFVYQISCQAEVGWGELMGELIFMVKKSVEAYTAPFLGFCLTAQSS